jgi:cytoskeletal protein RodZ
MLKENLGMTQQTYFRPDQVEKLQELGSRLRKMRQEQSISLERVSTQTRISLRLLQAIEEADLNVLPQSVYLKGLLKRYGDALGLNGAEIANELPQGDVLAGIAPSWQNVTFRKRRSLPLYFIYVFALVSFISGLSYLFQRPTSEIGQISQPEGEEVREAQPSRATSPLASQSPLLEPTTSVSLAQSPSGKPVVVNITLQDESWLRIEADGKTEFEGILRKGEQRTWGAREELVIRAGNAGGVTIGVNGQQAKPLGEPGAVETVTYQAPSPSQVSSQYRGG